MVHLGRALGLRREFAVLSLAVSCCRRDCVTMRCLVIGDEEGAIMIILLTRVL